MTLRRRLQASPFRLDADSLDALYRRHADELLVFLARRVLDPTSAVDLLAETFTEAYEDRKRFKGRSESDATGWLYGIARNLALAHLRKARAESRAMWRLSMERRELTDTEIERIEELASLAEPCEAVRVALPALSTDQRLAVSMRVVEELGYKEIADRLQVTEQTVRARVSRGLQALAAEVEARTERG